jgi:hypothetical protein
VVSRLFDHNLYDTFINKYMGLYWGCVIIVFTDQKRMETTGVDGVRRFGATCLYTEDAGYTFF